MSSRRRRVGQEAASEAVTNGRRRLLLESWWRRGFGRLRTTAIVAWRWDRALYREVDPLISEVATSTDPQHAYETAALICGLISDRMVDGYPDGTLYVLWADLGDLFESESLVQLGWESELLTDEQAHAVILLAAKEWLATPLRRRHRYLRQWADRNLRRTALALQHRVQH